MRSHQVALLVIPSARAMRLAPIAGGAIAGLAVLALVRLNPELGLAGLVAALRLSAVALALGAAFALDDPTEDTISPTPTPLLLRRAPRVTLVAAAVAASWSVVCWYAASTPGVEEVLPVRDLTIELASLTAVALAAAAIATIAVADRTGGIIAAPTLLLLTVVAALLPTMRIEVSLFPQPLDPGWATAHRQWLAVLAVAFATLIVASRGPGRRNLRQWRRATA